MTAIDRGCVKTPQPTNADWKLSDGKLNAKQPVWYMGAGRPGNGPEQALAN